jgi:cell division protein FtsB
MHQAEENPRFRRAMYLMLLLLLIGYIGFKAWHLSMAFGAWEGQAIVGDVPGAAK